MIEPAVSRSDERGMEEEAGDLRTAAAAASHFSAEAHGEPTGAGRYVDIDAIMPAEFLPGLTFRPVLGQRAMASFVNFAPGARAPRHVHEEEQMVIILEGELNFDLDGEVRSMRPGDVAVIPAWVPHAAWTSESSCLEVDIFCPPRKTLLALAEEQQTGDNQPGSDLHGRD
jgi:quercetin dioxygenase-like cupin family protein